jgi:Uma2 family endonuclease
VSEPAQARLTVDELGDCDEDRRIELVDGELVEHAMTSFEHGDAQLSLGGHIKLAFGGSGPPGGEGWWIATEVDVVYSPSTLLRHDVSGWRKARVPERPVGKRVETRPDWVCEILSTDRNHDLVTKRGILHAAGVPHYWTVDLEAPLLTVLRHHPDGYLIVATVAPGELARLEPFDLVEFEVAKLFGDIE